VPVVYTFFDDFGSKLSNRLTRAEREVRRKAELKDVSASTQKAAM
jgi:hypothetical protein